MYNAPDLSLCVCLFPHKTGALQGIGSRRSVPVGGVGRHMFLEGCRSPSCLEAKERDSFIRSLQFTPFFKLLTLPLPVIGGLDAHHASEGSGGQ